MPHVFIDLTSLARWRGPFVGIPRCQQRYASHALEHVPGVRWTLFDPAIGWYRDLDGAVARRILDGSLRVDMLGLRAAAPPLRGFADRLPAGLRPAWLWATKTRRLRLASLERRRLAASRPDVAREIARRQERLVRPGERGDWFRPDGERIDRPAFRAVVGGPARIASSDTLLAAQFDWIDTDVAAVAARKREAGWRHVVLCHDLIPILFPQWYGAADVANFARHWREAFAIADRVIFTSECARRDADAWRRETGIRVADSVVVPLGADVASGEPAAALPAGLDPGRFALFVSTVEPRKNHALLAAAWRRLARSGLVARTGFRLVFAGRRGWGMGSFHDDLTADPLTRDGVVHVEDADDAVLERLYRDAAFCLYPPRYEGFGLPIVEALARGKPLLVSSAGPMPEVAGGFAVELDPGDVVAWETAMARWIGDPAEAATWGARAAAGYRPQGWDEAARRFFTAALAPP